MNLETLKMLISARINILRNEKLSDGSKLAFLSDKCCFYENYLKEIISEKEKEK